MAIPARLTEVGSGLVDIRVAALRQRLPGRDAWR